MGIKGDDDYLEEASVNESTNHNAPPFTGNSLGFALPSETVDWTAETSQFLDSELTLQEVVPRFLLVQHCYEFKDWRGFRLPRRLFSWSK